MHRSLYHFVMDYSFCKVSLSDDIYITFELSLLKSFRIIFKLELSIRLRINNSHDIIRIYLINEEVITILIIMLFTNVFYLNEKSVILLF